MSQKIINARSLYLEGIRDAHITEALDKYVGSQYIQHSTGVRDGKEGFQKFFTEFLKRYESRDIRLIRMIEDGNYVFVHAFQDLDQGTAKWITADIFDTDSEDKIIEHWDVIEAYTAPEETVSGHDVICGEFVIEDEEKTEVNKALIRNYLVDVFQNGHKKNIDKYISNSEFVQHTPTIADGIEAFGEYLEQNDITYDFVFKVLGQGNFVVSYSQVLQNAEKIAQIDIFRIQDLKIVEHWSATEPVPPFSELVNSGKF